MVRVVLAIVAVDGVIKYFVDRTKKEVIAKWKRCTIRRCRNKGACGSRMEEHPEMVRNLSLGMCFVVLIQWLRQFGKKKSKAKKLGYSLLLGGSLSNVWDRWERKYVVDYVHVDCKGLRKIIFNLSDVCILLGGILVALCECFGNKRN